jgi:cyclophilin family peptidyl-prolyl cis-trans isomerase
LEGIEQYKRIDLGAVSGKYVARKYPSFFSEESSSTLRHDSPGVVSVRRGNDGGFGFTINRGGGPIINEANDLDKENIVIGRVLEGMDVVLRINEVPVIQSAKFSFS